MKLKYYGSATVLVEHDGIKVLCDPWFSDGAYYGSWYRWPRFEPDLKDFENLDYVYLSHIHPDHTDVNFLKTLDKNVTVIICEYEEKYLKRLIEGLGFTRVIELPNMTTMALGDDFNIEMYAADFVQPKLFAMAHSTNEPKNYRRTLQIDSLAVFSGGGRVLVNCNDVPSGLAQVPLQYIKRKYDHIDCALVPYAGAGPFPQAYDFPSEDKGTFAINSAGGYLVNTTLEHLRRLQPSVYIPFAGGYVIGGKNHHMNKYKGVCELEHLVDDLVPLVKQQMKSEMLVLDAGGTYDLSMGGFTKPFQGTDFKGREEFIQSVSGNKYDFEDDPILGDMTADFHSAYQTLLRKMGQYDYHSDWSVVVVIDQETTYQIPFDGSGVKKGFKEDGKPYLRINIDPRLMRRILDRKANWNNAEVGSHLLMLPKIPAGRQGYEPMVHFLMAYFQVPRNA